jgi:hypothetical protein
LATHFPEEADWSSELPNDTLTSPTFNIPPSSDTTQMHSVSSYDNISVTSFYPGLYNLSSTSLSVTTIQTESAVTEQLQHAQGVPLYVLLPCVIILSIPVLWVLYLAIKAIVVRRKQASVGADDLTFDARHFASRAYSNVAYDGPVDMKELEEARHCSPDKDIPQLDFVDSININSQTEKLNSSNVSFENV